MGESEEIVIPSGLSTQQKNFCLWSKARVDAEASKFGVALITGSPGKETYLFNSPRAPSMEKYQEFAALRRKSAWFGRKIVELDHELAGGVLPVPGGVLPVPGPGPGPGPGPSPGPDPGPGPGPGPAPAPGPGPP